MWAKHSPKRMTARPYTLSVYHHTFILPPPPTCLQTTPASPRQRTASSRSPTSCRRASAGLYRSVFSRRRPPDPACLLSPLLPVPPQAAREGGSPPKPPPPSRTHLRHGRISCPPAAAAALTTSSPWPLPPRPRLQDLALRRCGCLYHRCPPHLAPCCCLSFKIHSPSPLRWRRPMQAGGGRSAASGQPDTGGGAEGPAHLADGGAAHGWW
jgi:hypothetical protein